MCVSRWSKLGLTVLVSLAMSLGCGGSGGGGGGGPDGGGGNACTVTGVSVASSAPSVNPNQAATFTATVSESGACSGDVTWSVSQVGGTVTPNKLVASFSSATPGTYTVTATSKDDATKSGSAQVIVKPPCGTANGAIVSHTSNITASETWPGDGTTHQIPGSIQIRAPATVTIEACAIVQIGAGSDIDIVGDINNNASAKVIAAGTNGSTGFIVFEPMPGSANWGYFRGINQRSFLELHFSVLTQGGNGNTFGSHAPIYMLGPGHFLPPQGVLTLDQVVIDQPVGAAVFLDSEAAFTSQSTGFEVRGATDYPVQLEIMATGTIPSYVSGGNAQDAAMVIGPSGNVFSDLTITGNMPLYITQDINVVPPAGSVTPLGVTLTLQPGAELRFKPIPPGSASNAQGLRMVFGGVGNPGLNPIGRLIALGTPGAPIRFTSASPTPGAGDWAGLLLLTATGSEMAFNIVEYAGAPAGYVSANCRPTGTSDAAALIIGGTDFVPLGGMITSSVIQSSAGHGIDAVWANGQVNEPDLTAGNLFNDIQGCKQTYNALISGSCPVGGGCTQ
jgi:hypothetical protein